MDDVQDLTSRPDLSIIIVNWNSAAYLRECLWSIVAESADVAYEVIVIDNASTSDNLDELAAEFPWVTMIRHDGNCGFARANNLAFERAAAPTVLFLNPDTIVRGRAIAEMLDVFKRFPDAGIVGCQLLNSDGSLQTSCVQRYPRVLNQTLSADIFFTRFPRLALAGVVPLYRVSDRPSTVEVVSGACLMIRSDVFERVGGFSKEYFMYAEDVDLCYKVARQGWKCLYTGSAVVVHHGGGSSRLRPVSSWAAVVQSGAKLQFVRRTRGPVYASVYLVAVASNAAMRWTLAAGLCRIRGNSWVRAKEKWLAILRWSLNPDGTVRRLTSAAAK
jgi:N-acetylglucosaminyl-diphospho-decaprenol L-rhamnosyltransferase